MSATIIFDSQDYARRLEQAGFTPQQAEILKEHGEHLRAALQPLLRFYEETAHRDLATKGDVMDTRLEIERVRAEVERVRADLKVDIEKIRAELKTDIATVKYDLLKWQIGIALAGFGGLAAIMAKGFGWIGF
ncbi:hypothetical protein [uncultured Desulfovibrio sp.]|uniref:hypothetical protein n=1 Tax=uncultured Desulfovibrio sp. TaxID=167968 RepID=UPI00261B4A9D|nr:hypothetical protein [uncultured Desulfovibrio sp.]